MMFDIYVGCCVRLCGGAMWFAWLCGSECDVLVGVVVLCGMSGCVEVLYM